MASNNDGGPTWDEIFSSSSDLSGAFRQVFIKSAEVSIAEGDAMMAARSLREAAKYRRFEEAAKAKGQLY